MTPTLFIAQAPTTTTTEQPTPACEGKCPFKTYPGSFAGVFAAGLITGILLARIFCKGRKSGSTVSARSEAKRISHYAHSNSGCVEIYVGNLSYDMTEDQLRKEFEKFGKVEMARIILNRFQKSKGFGFVEMPNRAEAEAAINALNDKDIMGRKLRVNEAKNKSRD